MVWALQTADRDAHKSLEDSETRIQSIQLFVVDRTNNIYYVLTQDNEKRKYTIMSFVLSSATFAGRRDLLRESKCVVCSTRFFKCFLFLECYCVAC